MTKVSFCLLVCLHLASRSVPGFTLCPRWPRITNVGGRKPNTVLFAALEQPPILIVGKTIVDEYGHPNTTTTRSSSENSSSIIVGGGGPQAAIGSALALAARDYMKRQEDDTINKENILLEPPPKQPVYFMAPVGDLDFGSTEEAALLEILEPAVCYPPRLLRGKNLVTPRIRLWHESTPDNQAQTLRWYALNDSFGDQGAGGLWGSVPSEKDYIDLLDTIVDSSTTRIKPILHVICEGGAQAPGSNGDSRPLLATDLRGRISFLGVEPILFAEESTGVVSAEDAQHCMSLLRSIMEATTADSTTSAPVVISPDMPAYQAMQETNGGDNLVSKSQFLDSWAVRNGPKGSVIVQSMETELESTAGTMVVPAAKLTELVNPTGAGNSYAAAYTVLRGSGCDAIESACIATAVGAVFCEHSHCPPYSWEVIQRVVHASQEVRERIRIQ